MKIEEIREIAVKNGIKPGRMKKSDIVRAIQQSENNISCFDSGDSERCGQPLCLWRPDCK
jgi:hypothetical protein